MSGMCDGRVCIVTGAGRGIGREYALMLADHGALVVVNDIGARRDGTGIDQGPAQQVVDEIVDKGGHAVANTDDVSDFESARNLVGQAIDEFGRLDVVINNAGILRDRTLTNMTEAEWDAVIKVHLKGTFAPSHHAAVYWRDQFKSGKAVDARIINTTSVSGIYGNIGQSNYGAAKQGIAGFTFIAALELKRYGVTANAIAPGALTRLTEDLGPGDASDEEKAEMSPRWIAPLCTWLASPLSGDVTGRVFEASGAGLVVAEGWHPGPRGAAVADARDVDGVVRKLLSNARPPAAMDGSDIEGWVN